ncbi:MAG: hypothetical protein OEM41_09580 [Ignavibacteria bacterium]|nr:hypothetical protein [Ignavibacteria bacterium]
MVLLWFVLSFAVSFAAVAIVLPSIVETYGRYCRTKIVLCPRLHREAAITVSARLAALTSVFLPTIIRIRDCNAWPEVKHCDRQCLSQVR